jgi:hypothetical protein
VGGALDGGGVKQRGAAKMTMAVLGKSHGNCLHLEKCRHMSSTCPSHVTHLSLPPPATPPCHYILSRQRASTPRPLSPSEICLVPPRRFFQSFYMAPAHFLHATAVSGHGCAWDHVLQFHRYAITEPRSGKNSRASVSTPPKWRQPVTGC